MKAQKLVSKIADIVVEEYGEIIDCGFAYLIAEALNAAFDYIDLEKANGKHRGKSK